MFTGIVEEIGIVKETSRDHLAFQAYKVLEGTKVGDSISVNGVCKAKRSRLVSFTMPISSTIPVNIL